MNTVLVIDREDDRQILVSALEDAGFKVMVEVESGNGLRRAVEEVPGAIILDEDMPPLDGVELLPVLRSFTDSLIVVKGSGQGLAATQALLQGADLYLPRSVSVKEVLVRVHALLRRLLNGKNPSAKAYSASASVNGNGSSNGNAIHDETFLLG